MLSNRNNVLMFLYLNLSRKFIETKFQQQQSTRSPFTISPCTCTITMSYTAWYRHNLRTMYIYIYIRSKTTHNHVGILHCHRIISTDDDNNNSVYIIYLYDDAHDPTARARSVHAGYTFCILLTAFIYLTTSVYRYLVPNYLHTTTGNSCPALRYGI
ncbi:unnamed protein product [Aphis gossypii]|uniref:Uncharacterized protein n=1 Tax=Aphis gossypii TaxID=80765 RepID=A0A9P0J9T0_APHGO|nr:unnamed protein product [Aphis gossypii]